MSLPLAPKRCRLSATERRGPQVLVPILENIVGYDSARIRTVFESQGFVIQEWGEAQTDSLTIATSP